MGACTADITRMLRTVFHLMLLLAALTGAIRPGGLLICIEPDGLVRVEASGGACAAERPCAGASADAASYHQFHGCDDYAVMDAGRARADEGTPLSLPGLLDHLVSTQPAEPSRRTATVPSSHGAPPRPQAPRGDVLRI